MALRGDWKKENGDKTKEAGKGKSNLAPLPKEVLFA
jgi:hypothetical protein